jgi:hypothetical protein
MVSLLTTTAREAFGKPVHAWGWANKPRPIRMS